MANHPVLYSYRRCPYAMRARMAIAASGLQVEQREIVFWDKPEEMMEASPKGEVPVLILPNGQVVDESRDIMIWALQKRDPLKWQLGSDQVESGMALMDACDFEFKEHLDHYKYADRFPEYSQMHYRKMGEEFLNRLESILVESQAAHSVLALNGSRLSIVDIAIFPFIRQFVNVDKTWFEQGGYPCLQQWLAQHLQSDYFLAIMKNRPVWQTHFQPLWVIESELQTRDQFLTKALAEQCQSK